MNKQRGCLHALPCAAVQQAREALGHEQRTYRLIEKFMKVQHAMTPAQKVEADEITAGLLKALPVSA